jgi:hypothetical protein
MPLGLKKVTPGSVSTHRHFLGLPIFFHLTLMLIFKAMRQTVKDKAKIYPGPSAIDEPENATYV